MHLFIVSDGKKGHENQSLGLAEAILRRREGDYEVGGTEDSLSLPSKKPDLIISAGHSTHPFLLRLARKFRCPSVVIMKPSLPLFLFSHCLIPEHDLKPGKKLRKNIIATKGPLNRISENNSPKEKKGLILIGGPSKHYQWDTQAISSAVNNIIATRQDLSWTITNSRRSPSNQLSLLSESKATLAPCEETPSGWLPEELASAKEVWVTPDSSSMVFEALTAGCGVGLLPLSPLDSRIARENASLLRENKVTAFSKDNLQEPLPVPTTTFHETARCAELLLSRLYPS